MVTLVVGVIIYGLQTPTLLNQNILPTNSDTNTTAPTNTNTGNVGLANPASTNCQNVGGRSQIVTKEDGSQYSVCYFEDNRQCEEWALLRGDCPVGGFKITGYVTIAAQYCAITGGTYTITKAAPEMLYDQEQGNCQLKDGTMCDVWKFYNGQCPGVQ